MPELASRLFRLYGNRWDFYQVLSRLVELMEKASGERSSDLVAQDEKRAERPDWFLREDTLGVMLYVDLFATNFEGLLERLPYLKKRGITYVHLMPLFRAPELHNDGGYAVSSYRDVDPRLGTTAGLADLAATFRKEGIALVLDFVFNHTSDEHDWALRAKKGERKFRDYYFIFETEAEAREYDSSLREIFPDTRRGSFTYVKEAGGWVWTTFNSFQWDLNYRNPEVFLAMCGEMLALANLGIDVLRLDALAFVWKQKGTGCENLAEAHVLIQAFQLVAKIACPSLIFKSEAIVHPDEVIRYIGEDECRLSYNPLQMALFWEAAATRNTSLLRLSLSRRWALPERCGWVNYIRCHDDIGWTFSDEDAASLGIQGYNHRNFLNRFYTGSFEGTFSRGEAFQLNPETGDCRICGTMASLCGLEQAYEMYAESLAIRDAALRDKALLYADMAVRRMSMMYAVLLALPGVPLLYMGDETAILNDHSWQNTPGKSNDSRWVHRIATDWKRIDALETAADIKDSRLTMGSAPAKDGSLAKNGGLTKEAWLIERQAAVLAALDAAVSRRKAEPLFGGSGIGFPEVRDSRVFAFTRSDKLRVYANFSEQTVFCPLDYPLTGTDLLGGQKFENTRALSLMPYQVLWIKEKGNE